MFWDGTIPITNTVKRSFASTFLVYNAKLALFQQGFVLVLEPAVQGGAAVALQLSEGRDEPGIKLAKPTRSQ